MPEIIYRQILAIQKPIAQIPVSDATLRLIMDHEPPPGQLLVDSVIDVPLRDYRILRNLVGRRTGKDGRKAGIGAVGLSVLTALRDHGPGDCRLIARRAGIPSRRASDAAGYLCRAGLVDKRKQTGRMFTYTITGAGLEQLAAAGRRL